MAESFAHFNLAFSSLRCVCGLVNSKGVYQKSKLGHGFLVKLSFPERYLVGKCFFDRTVRDVSNKTHLCLHCTSDSIHIIELEHIKVDYLENRITSGVHCVFENRVTTLLLVKSHWTKNSVYPLAGRPWNRSATSRDKFLGPTWLVGCSPPASSSD